MNNLKSINGSFNPQSNDSLINFTGLDSLSHIEELVVYNNNQMHDFQGLEKVTSLSEGLHIEENGALESLNGLDSLKTIDDILMMYENPNLVDISALKNTEFLFTNIGTMVEDNKKLSFCSIQSICNYCPGYCWYINSNAPGCNSIEEVDSICTQIGIDEFENVLSSSIEVYPNPANNTLCLSIEEPVECVEVFNMQGQLLLCEEYEEGIPVSGFSPGVYFLKAYTKEEVLVAKFVKE